MKLNTDAVIIVAVVMIFSRGLSMNIFETIFTTILAVVITQLIPYFKSRLFKTHIFYCTRAIKISNNIYVAKYFFWHSKNKNLKNNNGNGEIYITSNVPDNIISVEKIDLNQEISPKFSCDCPKNQLCAVIEIEKLVVGAVCGVAVNVKTDGNSPKLSVKNFEQFTVLTHYSEKIFLEKETRLQKLLKILTILCVIYNFAANLYFEKFRILSYVFVIASLVFSVETWGDFMKRIRVPTQVKNTIVSGIRTKVKVKLKTH